MKKSIVAAIVSVPLIFGAFLAFGADPRVGGGNWSGRAIPSTITNPTSTCINVNGGAAELCVTDGVVTLQAQTSVSSANPIQKIIETDAAADEKRWWVNAINGILLFSGYADNEGSAFTWLSVDRAGVATVAVTSSANSWNFPTAAMTFGGTVAFGSGAPTVPKKYSATIDVVSVAAGTCRQDTIDTADTADLNDDCHPNFPTNNVGLTRQCYYDGAQIVVNTCNVSSAAIDPASTTYTCTCFED